MFFLFFHRLSFVCSARHTFHFSSNQLWRSCNSTRSPSTTATVSQSKRLKTIFILYSLTIHKTWCFPKQKLTGHLQLNMEFFNFTTNRILQTWRCNFSSLWICVVFAISEHFYSQDLISNSPYCVPYNSCNVSLKNLVLDQHNPFIDIFLCSPHLSAW